MPSDKPTTSELIQELRSISDYLSDEQDLIDDIPILTEVAEKPNAERSKAKDLEMAHDSDAGDDIEPAQNEVDTDHAASSETNTGTVQATGKVQATDKIQATSTGKPSASMFDKPLQQEPVTSKKGTSKSTDDNNSGKRPEMKARGENPFLPPHIRKQLGQHKKTAPTETPLWPKSDFAEAPAKPSTDKKVEVQGDLLSGFGENMIEKPETKALTEKEKSIERVVDEVLKEMMPHIEKRLREKLKTDIAAWKDSE